LSHNFLKFANPNPVPNANINHNYCRELRVMVTIAYDYWCRSPTNLVKSASFSFDRINSPHAIL